MNESLKRGFGPQLRDLLVAANPFDPQVLVLSPQGAWKIGSAIVKHPRDYYLRAKEAAYEALEVIGKGYEENGRKLPPNEVRTFEKIRVFLEKAPDNSKPFVERNLTEFEGRVKNFSSRNYLL
jgi:hypothetical protein